MKKTIELDNGTILIQAKIVEWVAQVGVDVVRREFMRTGLSSSMARGLADGTYTHKVGYAWQVLILKTLRRAA